MKLGRSQSGDLLFKAVSIKVFFPGNKKSNLKVYRLPFGNGFSDHNVDTILARVAEKIQQNWPGHEYSVVQLRPNSFNFVWRRCLPNRADDFEESEAV